jgi:hypothetical protein
MTDPAVERSRKRGIDPPPKSVRKLTIGVDTEGWMSISRFCRAMSPDHVIL